MPVENKEANVRQTYLALRVAIVLLVGLLFLTILAQLVFVSLNCWQTSISAYYFTSVRPVFVGSLCAVGACLIIYRGNNDYENTALDYSGFMAFIVAFVPTGRDTACPPTNGPDEQEIAVAVGTNVGALLAIGVIATVITLAVPALRQDRRSPSKLYSLASVFVTLALLIVGIVMYVWQRPFFLKYGHLGAAVALFVGIVLVVVLNAVFAAKPYKHWYFGVAIAMVLVLVLGLALILSDVRHWALWLEALLIAMFAAFWIVQTVELGTEVNRAEAGTSDPGHGA
ncbi:hypothetical protein [Lentzea flava]|uniref:DUF998 domain-containing protein n=1 Tax=Lentzea flava TaxID=103732 RepID=A0ABQ2V4U2_9PSEU|nr:hypothetical protein [Lentzea flava]MCP2203253.1 hypothetical protein [Lentzea flava]GGU66781.1 hypothetical protein GCM10010178_68300 [Lentzea flava]